GRSGSPRTSRTLTRGCVASIPCVESGEASRRRRNVEKEPATKQLPTLTKWHWLPKPQPRPPELRRSDRDRASSRTAHRRDGPRGPSGHHSEAGVAAARRGGAG